MLIRTIEIMIYVLHLRMLYLPFSLFVKDKWALPGNLNSREYTYFSPGKYCAPHYFRTFSSLTFIRLLIHIFVYSASKY